MTRDPSHPLIARVAAPLTAVVLIAMAGYSLLSMRVGGNEAYLDDVAQAIEDLPLWIEGYRGADQPPIQAAVELLRPNKLLQREYVDPLSGERFSVLVVHCADVRDMMGHYPPRCYPSNGWDMLETREDAIERSRGGPIPVMRYRVSLQDGSTRYARVIANTFVVPRADDPLGRDDDALDRVTRTRWSSGLGAAQVQIITDEGMDPDTRARIERSVADELDGLIEAIARGGQSRGEST